MKDFCHTKDWGDDTWTSALNESDYFTLTYIIHGVGSSSVLCWPMYTSERRRTQGIPLFPYRSYLFQRSQTQGLNLLCTSSVLRFRVDLFSMSFRRRFIIIVHSFFILYDVFCDDEILKNIHHIGPFLTDYKIRNL